MGIVAGGVLPVTIRSAIIIRTSIWPSRLSMSVTGTMIDCALSTLHGVRLYNYCGDQYIPSLMRNTYNHFIDLLLCFSESRYNLKHDYLKLCL